LHVSRILTYRVSRGGERGKAVNIAFAAKALVNAIAKVTDALGMCKHCRIRPVGWADHTCAHCGSTFCIPCFVKMGTRTDDQLARGLLSKTFKKNVLCWYCDEAFYPENMPTKRRSKPSKSVAAKKSIPRKKSTAKKRRKGL